MLRRVPYNASAIAWTPLDKYTLLCYHTFLLFVLHASCEMALLRPPEYFTDNGESNLSNILNAVVTKIKAGVPVCFPTDTVYAVAADPYNAYAVEALYHIKGRDQSKPLALLVSNLDVIEEFVIMHSLTYKFIKKIETQFPGLVTFILDIKANHPITMHITSNKKIGIRRPALALAQEIINLTGQPIAATSVNKSGESCSIDHKDIPDEFSKSCYIIRSNLKGIGVASTVLDLSVLPSKPMILREGAVLASEIERIYSYFQ